MGGTASSTKKGSTRDRPRRGRHLDLAPLTGLAPGFDANKAPHTTDLSGRTVTVRDARGTRIGHTFTDDTLTWTYEPATAIPSR